MVGFGLQDGVKDGVKRVVIKRVVVWFWVYIEKFYISR